MHTDARAIPRPVLAIALIAALALALLPALAGGYAQAEEHHPDLEHACPEEDTPHSGFIDIAGNPHEHAIHCAAWWDIASGGPGGRPSFQYGPELPVRRDQMASFVVRLIDESDGRELAEWDGQNRFTDVADNNVHVEAINRLATAEIVLGRTDDTYEPGAVVRRDQMGSFLARAIAYVTGVQRTSDEDQFTDVGEGNPHRQAINGLAEEGIVQGRAPGVYAPADAVRRDAMAAFVMRGMNLHVEEGDATPPETEPNGETSEETPEDNGDGDEDEDEEDDCPIPGWPEELPCEPPFP